MPPLAVRDGVQLRRLDQLRARRMHAHPPPPAHRTLGRRPYAACDGLCWQFRHCLVAGTNRKLHVCPGRYGIVVGSRVRGRSRDARPGVSSLLPVTCWSPSSSPSCALRADRARAAGGATPHPSQFCSREPPPPPLVCPLRGAPLGLAAPPPPCTLAHASASASADRLSWATSRLQLGANLAADRTGRVFGVVSPVRVPCAVCCATRCGRTLLDFGAVPPRIDLE